MICIYSQNNTEYTKNGDAVLIPSVCELQMTINGTWALSIEHPYDPEERYKYIVEGAVIRADIKCIRELTTVHQRFRIYHYTKNLHSVTAIAFPIAMESTYDSPIDNLVITAKTGVQAMATLQSYSNKYTLSTDINTIRSTSLANTNINNAIASGDANSFIKVWGGEILYDNLKYSVKSLLGDDNADYLIHYGRNLSEIDYQTDDSGLTTRIKPISKDGIRLNGSGYVDSPKIYDYPIIHTRYMQAPYDLIEDDDTSNSATAIATRTAKATVGASTTNESEDAYDAAMEAGYQPEYIKTIKSNIVSAVQTMALASVTSTSLYNYLAQVIADNMAWLGNLEQPEWDWRGSYENGWWYGNDDSYAKSMYVHIGKKWSYFGANGYWQEPADDSETWDWYQVTGEDGKRFGNFNKYYAHDEYVYITMDGVLKKYWFNNEGWYEAENSGDSEWDWHGSGTSEDPYWFGEEAASAEDTKKFAHDVWLFIDGALYFFDHFGYYTPGSQRQDYQWDWVEEDERFWFGNAENHEYAAVYLTSQWCKINGTWYYFDANGYVVAENTSRANSVSLFTREMAALKTEVDTQSNALYTVLYGLMTAFANQQYTDGADVPAITITVNMVDLSKTTEYSGYAALEQVKLGDSVKCIDDVHDISLTSRVIGLTYDCIRDFNKQVVIGTPTATVSQILGNAGGTPVAGGFDTSALEAQINANAEAIEGVADDVQELQDGKQNKLTAGSGINITGNVISATGGSGGLEYFHETQNSLYGQNTIDDELRRNGNYRFNHAVSARYNLHEPFSTWGDVQFDTINDNGEVVIAVTWERTIITSLWSQSTGEDNGIMVITTDPTVCGLNATDRTSIYQTLTASYVYGDFTDEQSHYDSIGGWATSTFTYQGTTYYVMLCHNNTYKDWSYEADSIKTIGSTLHYKDDRDIYSSVAEFALAVFTMSNTGQTISSYSGLHQGDDLAFFAGGSDSNGTDAPIKIFTDGTTEGLVTEEDLQDYAKLEDLPQIEANPSETPTDVLNSINIDGTAYEIQGGGGGSSGSAYREVVLWNNPTSTASWSNPVTMTLNDDITNYYELKVVFSNQSGNTYGYITIPVSEVLAHNYTQYFSNDAIGGASNYVLVNAINEITGYPKDTGTTSYYVKVIGIKYGGNLSPIIYSTEEREVGVWTDNKPLYQKTYANVNLSNNQDVVIDANVSTMQLKSYVIDFSGTTNTSTQQIGDTSDTLYIDSRGLIYWINRPSGWWSALSNANITVWYTKTTDVAGSGSYNTLGVPNVHYDGNEKVIGTWFGETLYERTYTYSGTYGGTDTFETDIPITHKIVNVFGKNDYIVDGQTYTVMINSPYAQFPYDIANNHYVYKFAVASRSLPTEIKMTVQYTKTS